MSASAIVEHRLRLHEFLIGKYGNRQPVEDDGLVALVRRLDANRWPIFGMIINNSPTGDLAGVESGKAFTLRFRESDDRGDADPFFVHASGTIAFTGAASDGEIITVRDGSETAATGTITSAGATPSNTDMITIFDGVGNSFVFEFTDGGGLSTGDIEVNKSATTTEGMEELRAAINGSVLELTAAAAVGPSPFSIVVTHDRTGVVGNGAGTSNSTGSNPPTGPANFTGGSGSRIFELDDDASVTAGHVAVAIGASLTETAENLAAAINAQTAFDIEAGVDYAASDPTTTVKNTNPGTAGNAVLDTDGANITVVGMAGGAEANEVTVRVGGSDVTTITVQPGARVVFIMEAATKEYLRFDTDESDVQGQLVLSAWNVDLQEWQRALP